MDMRERLEAYVTNITSQLKDAERQAAMYEGALRFAKQLLSDLDADAAEAADASEPEQQDN